MAMCSPSSVLRSAYTPTRCLWTTTSSTSTSRSCRECSEDRGCCVSLLTPQPPSFCSLYWSEQDVLSFLSENSDDAHLKRVKAWHEKSSSAVHSSAGDENASPEVGADGAAGVSKQRAKSEAGKKSKLEFGGLRRPSPGHRIQDIKEMDTVPVRAEWWRQIMPRH